MYLYQVLVIVVVKVCFIFIELGYKLLSCNISTAEQENAALVASTTVTLDVHFYFLLVTTARN